MSRRANAAGRRTLMRLARSVATATSGGRAHGLGTERVGDSNSNTGASHRRGAAAATYIVAGCRVYAALSRARARSAAPRAPAGRAGSTRLEAPARGDPAGAGVGR